MINHTYVYTRTGVSLLCLVAALVVVTRNERASADTVLEGMQILTTAPGRGTRVASVSISPPLRVLFV